MRRQQWAPRRLRWSKVSFALVGVVIVFVVVPMWHVDRENVIGV